VVDGREVERLVDLALIAAPLAHHRHRDLVRAADLGGQCDAYRVQHLGGHRRADGHQVMVHVAVVAGHLAPSRRGIGGLGVLGEHEVARRHPEGQAGRDRAVERGDPIMLAPERPGDADLGALVTLAADDEGDATGTVEHPHPFVERPRQRDQPVHLEQVGVGETDSLTRMRGAAGRALRSLGRRHRRLLALRQSIRC
jgi:hypothetical protein